MRFLKDIQEKFKRLKEVESNMQAASVAKDPNALKALGREMRELQRIQTLYGEFEKVEAHIKDSEHLLGDEKDADMREMAEADLKSLRVTREKTLADLEALLVKKDPILQKNAIVEIRAGTGGLEASLFAADIFRMYTRYAARKGFKAEVLSQAMTEAGGIREVIFSVSGGGVFGRFKFESGVHRVQRVPVTEASGRIHTSAITVAVLPEADPIEVNIKTEDLKIEVFRSGGPGGQSVNTTDSAVRITHIPTGVAVKCQDEKSQLKNKAKAMQILTARIYDQIQHASREKIAKTRKAQIGSGDRSEKIRTYNFPERRVTDHRIGLTIHNLDGILDGDMDQVIDVLHEKEAELASK